VDGINGTVAVITAANAGSGTEVARQVALSGA